MSTVLWAAYVAAVGSLAALAAYVIEPVARALRWPTRWLWAIALLAQLGAVLVAVGAPDGARPAAWFTGLWITVSVAAIAVYLRAVRALRRERGSWRVTVAEDMPVWVSERTGPAVVGFLRSIVVAPGWAMALAERQRRMLLRHEAEHVAAWDPTLLLAGLVTCAAVPWSPATWWALARLRLAIEVDCDRRVLAAEPDVAAYGELLVAVQGRVVPGAAGLAAFAERQLPLEERIEVMTARRPRGAAWRWSARGAVAGALVLAACMAPRPTTTTSVAGIVIRGDEMTMKYNSDGTRTITAKNATITTKPDSAMRVTRVDTVPVAPIIRDSALYSQLSATTRALTDVLRPDSTVRRLNEMLRGIQHARAAEAAPAPLVSSYRDVAAWQSNRSSALASATLREHFKRADVTAPAPHHIAMFVLDEDGDIVQRRDLATRHRDSLRISPEEVRRLFPELPAGKTSFQSGWIDGRVYGLDSTTQVAWWLLGSPPTPVPDARRRARERDDSITLARAYARIADTVAAHSRIYGLVTANAPVTVRVLLAADHRVLGLIHGPLIARASVDSVLASFPHVQEKPTRGGVVKARPEHALPPESEVVWAQLRPPQP